MALTQWSPFSEFVSLRDAMDRLFSESLVRPGGAPGRLTTPPYDLYETEDSLIYRFALPGIRPEDVDITTQQGMLTVSGRYPQPEESQNWIWHVRGLPQGGTIQFTVSLPTLVDTDRAEARFEHGVLTLTMPKSETVKPKRIAIAVSHSQQSGKALEQGHTQSG
jgi:HSP20 family protein